jgi:DNA-binding winged helix-turn-helix (wHTH) protein/TolB-like protein/tetratricopeptide (TPR) repeat protein
MSEPAKGLYEFGPYRIDARDGLLLRDGEVVPLAPKAFDLLLVLVENNRRVLSKEELMKRLWPESFVEEANLSHHVFVLRKALGDANGNKHIETIPRRGYRFVADVNEWQDEGPGVIVAEYSRSHIVIEDNSTRDTHDGWASQGVQLDPLTSSEKKGVARRRLLLPLLIPFLAVIGLGLALYVWLSARKTGAPTDIAVKSIAVLPFKPLVAESRDPALELGITDALISKLSNIRQVAVRPTTSVLKYTAEGQDLRTAGSELGVEVLLDGKVQRVNDRVRLSVQLVRTADGSPIWADKFDEKFTDIFAVQDAISDRVAFALAPRLSGEEKKGLTRRYTDNIEAYQLYLKGRHHWSTFKQSDLLTSINYYNEALKNDPDYALAYVGLANAYSVLGIYGPPTAKEAMPQSRDAAQKALKLDENLAEAHVALGAVKIFYDWDWPGAEREFKRALDLNPNYTDGHSLYGYYLAAMGKLDEAAAEHRRAKELAPEWHIPSRDVLLALFEAGRYDEAIEQCRQTIELDPHEGFAYYILGQSYTQQGRFDEAATELERAIREGSVNASGEPPPKTLAELGYLYAVTRKKAEALKVITQLQKKPYVWTPFLVAEIYAGLSDKTRAWESLNKAYDERFPFLWRVKIMPQFDRLRLDPEYADLMRRMNLSQ